MKVKRNNIPIVVGAGDVENAWIPILNAINRYKSRCRCRWRELYKGTFENMLVESTKTDLYRNEMMNPLYI